MSTSEEQNSPEAEAPEDEEMEAEASEPMEPPKLTEEKSGAGATIFLFFILGFVASLIVGWVVFPKLLYSKKKQPLNYNHALHVAEVEEECESCHYFREDGSFSGVPTISHCIECHEDVNGEDPEEEKFVREYVEAGKEVPWLIYAKQPPCVFFSHAAHPFIEPLRRRTVYPGGINGNCKDFQNPKQCRLFFYSNKRICN